MLDLPAPWLQWKFVASIFETICKYFNSWTSISTVLITIVGFQSKNSPNEPDIHYGQSANKPQCFQY